MQKDFVTTTIMMMKCISLQKSIMMMKMLARIEAIAIRMQMQIDVFDFVTRMRLFIRVA